MSLKQVGHSTNLAPNPGFESGGGWSEVKSAPFPATSIWRGSWGTGTPHTGGYAYAISNHAYGIVQSDYLAVQPSATYHLSAWLRGELDAEGSRGNWLLRAYYYDANKSSISYTNVDQSDTAPASWTEKGGDLTTPANAAYVRVQLYNYMNSGWVAYDDVTLSGPQVTTQYYYAGGQRVALRKNGVLHWLTGDHLGSTAVTAYDDGTKGAELRYKAWGKNRYTYGSTPTARRFTGQIEDAYIKLVQMGVRWYDPELGRWTSPDTIIPDPANPQSLNRYSYVYNNPLRFVDPSGYDPLDAAWEEDFRRANGRDPTDKDRHDRLFSLLFPGSGPGGSWTEDDWKRYAAADVHDNDGNYLGNRFWTWEEKWNPANPPSVHRFAQHVGRLAAWYTEGEEDLFVRAFAFVFAGIPYSGSTHLAAASVAGGPKVWQPLEEGEAGWEPLWVEPGDNPAHHYAGLLFAGYHYGDPAYYVNAIRDYNNPPDFVLGEIGVMHGQWLRRGIITPWLLDVNIMYMLSVGHPRDLQNIRQSLGQ